MQNNDSDYILSKLDFSHIDEAVELCGSCVGKNLYRKEYLMSILDKQDSFFYLLMDRDGAVIGYVFFEMAERKELAGYFKMEQERLLSIIYPMDMAVHFRSIGIAEEMRGKQLPDRLMNFALAFSRERLQADVMIGAFWKKGGKVPMERVLSGFGFKHFATAEKIWYDKTDLICPVCNGRCVCPAEIYYKRLKGENR